MADNKKFLIGSRGSKLSLAYSGHVKNLLLKFNSQFDDNSIEIKNKDALKATPCMPLPSLSPAAIAETWVPCLFSSVVGDLVW